jgi:hypothetical protein
VWNWSAVYAFPNLPLERSMLRTFRNLVEVAVVGLPETEMLQRVE